MRKHYASNQRLLDRVCYLSRCPSKDTDLFGNEIQVKHTFPYNPDSKTAPGTAKRWANNDTYDHKTCQYIKGPEPEFLDRANDPFSVTIIDLDVRSEGGRAYKVVDQSGRCFDLREDQVLEVFKHSGILAGGVIPGQFVWGILGSQMRMVLVGGDLHKEMTARAEVLKESNRKRASGVAPSEGTLKFGCIYRKRDGSLHAFLGKVKQPDVEKHSYAFVKLPERPSDYNDIELDDLERFNSEHCNHMREERDIAKKWEQMTWQERCQWDWYDRNAYLYRQYKDVEPGYYDHPEEIVLMTSPKFEEELVETAHDIAVQLRENAGAKHKYVNGIGVDLAEERWKRDHNDGENRQWNYDYRCDFKWFHIDSKERKRREKEARESAQKSYTATRLAYQKELQWES